MERGGFNDSVKKGLNILVHFVPRIGLEFLDFPLVIPNQQQFMNNFLTDELNHTYALNSLSICINDFSFDAPSLNSIFTALISNARTVNNVFSYFLDICTQFQSEEVNKTFRRKISESYSEIQIRAYLKEKIELMVEND
jgi:hypothetical protein